MARLAQVPRVDELAAVPELRGAERKLQERFRQEITEGVEDGMARRQPRW